MDACPLFGLKRRSFLFVIDKKQPQPRLFLYTGESVRFDKNAHCFAVEPSGWRFVPRVNSLSSLFRRFAPSDSPRVHQWHSDFIAMPQLCLPFGKHNITLAQAKISPPTAISFALSEFHSFNFCVQDSFVFSPRKNRPKYGRFFVVWIYCFLLKNALLILLPFVEKCFVDIIAFC